MVHLLPAVTVSTICSRLFSNISSRAGDDVERNLGTVSCMATPHQGRFQSVNER